MTPLEQIIPGFKLPDHEMVVYAKDQPEYIPLPAWKGPDGLRVTRWRLSWKERLQVLLGGSIWLSILTFEKPLQPVKMETSCPIMGSCRHLQYPRCWDGACVTEEQEGKP